MRHRRRGRVLGRCPSHRKALLRNLASSLFLTHSDAEFDSNPPKVKGRIVTTLQKAKEVRPLVEKCVTIARRSLKAEEEATLYSTEAERGSEEWRKWRSSDDWKKWCQARAPVVAARRRVVQLICDKQAVRILFNEIAPRFADRAGGYTRVLRLAKRRLGDAGTRAILEFVGTHDRVVKKSEKPTFSDEEEVEEQEVKESPEADGDERVTAGTEAKGEQAGAVESLADDSTGEDTEKNEKG